MRRILIATAAAALATLGLAACSSSPTRPAARRSTPAGPSPTASALAAPAVVSAVPGSNNNKYVAGPFTVTMTVGITRLPSRFDSVTQSGQDIPQYGSVIVVKNTSNTFAGWVAPEVEFVKGHSIQGQVLDTEAADPTAGSSGGQSDSLVPGQSETLYAAYHASYLGYATAQLVSVSYAPTGTAGMDATVIRLKY